MNTNLETEKMEKISKPLEVGANGMAHGFTKNVKEFSTEAVETISEGYGTALSWVKKNPLQAAAIGAGIGFVAGMAIRKYAGSKKT